MNRAPAMHRGQRGVSMIEVLITLFVLLVGLLALSAVSLDLEMALALLA